MEETTSPEFIKRKMKDLHFELGNLQTYLGHKAFTNQTIADKEEYDIINQVAEICEREVEYVQKIINKKNIDEAIEHSWSNLPTKKE